MKRPFAVLGMSLATSVAVASFLSEKVGFLAALFLLSAAVPCFFVRKIPKAMPVCLLCCTTGIFLYHGVLWLQYRPFDIYDQTECELHGQILSDAESSYDSFRYVVSVDSVNDETASFKVRLTTDEALFRKYETVSFTATLKKPSKIEGLNRQPQNTLYSKGLAFTVYAEAESVVREGEGKRPALAVFSDASDYLKDELSHLLGEKAGIAKAIMLGDKSSLSAEEREDFSRIGVSHLFAVSGLHLSVLLGFFLFLGKKLTERRVPIYLGGILLVLLFMALTGFSYSVCRAGIMAILMLLGALLFREPDSFNSLGLSVVILMLFNPLCALDLGFQMSVCATMGLVTLGPGLLHSVKSEEKQGVFLRFVKNTGAKIRNSFLITLCATVFMLPIYSYVFGRISLLMPIANLLLVPAGSCILVLSLVAVLLNALPFAGSVLSFLPAQICRLVILYVDTVRKILASRDSQSIGLSNSLSRFLIFFTLAVVLLWIHREKTQVSGKAVIASVLAMTLLTVCCNRILFANRTSVHLWGTDGSVCAVVNGDGYSLPFCAEGYYVDSLQEQYACKDDCFGTKDTASSVNGWEIETIDSEDGKYAFMILSCDESKILLCNHPGHEEAQQLLARGETYSYVFYRAGKNADTSFLLHGRIADTVFYCDGYDAVSQTAEKLSAVGYRVYDITDTAGVSLVLTDNGRCRVDFS